MQFWSYSSKISMASQKTWYHPPSQIKLYFYTIYLHSLNCTGHVVLHKMMTILLNCIQHTHGSCSATKTKPKASLNTEWWPPSDPCTLAIIELSCKQEASFKHRVANVVFKIWQGKNWCNYSGWTADNATNL